MIWHNFSIYLFSYQKTWDFFSFQIFFLTKFDLNPKIMLYIGSNLEEFYFLNFNQDIFS